MAASAVALVDVVVTAAVAAVATVDVAVAAGAAARMRRRSGCPAQSWVV